MSTFLLTVRSTELMSLGLRLSPGMRPSETKDRPAISTMIQGSVLELRRPFGSTFRTALVTYGLSVEKGDDGAILLYDDPKDPEIKLILSSDLTASDIPPGTEVWLVDETAS